MRDGPSVATLNTPANAMRSSSPWLRLPPGQAGFAGCAGRDCPVAAKTPGLTWVPAATVMAPPQRGAALALRIIDAV